LRADVYSWESDAAAVREGKAGRAKTTNPTSMWSTMTPGTEFQLQVVGNLLFADSVAYEISNVIPVQGATM
jgi:hypothetical protein